MGRELRILCSHLSQTYPQRTNPVLFIQGNSNLQRRGYTMSKHFEVCPRSVSASPWFPSTRSGFPALSILRGCAGSCLLSWPGFPWAQTRSSCSACGVHGLYFHSVCPMLRLKCFLVKVLSETPSHKITSSAAVMVLSWEARGYVSVRAVEPEEGRGAAVPLVPA